ncbi:hypothetical protein GPJ56_001528 [Histomonas meleagridis]|uniref:uncharacterized protein n=1 Tax=Histomonas meleagridis TaxID=135588 RepID=UPI003559A8AD|nr:hypothetical protein GPJ56_001528 [Histomonas meleagridis]KAH0807035.1 hypothetical protein GO595_000211 [Histomonas meleagridis]
MEPIQVVLQFLKEEGYKETFDTLVREAEVQYKEGSFQEHTLRQLLGEMKLSNQNDIIRKLVKGPKYSLESKIDTKAFNGSPISMISIDDSYLIASFTDGSIRKLSPNNEEIALINPKLSTILCFIRQNDNIYFGTMSGTIGILSLSTFSIVKTLNLPQGSIIAITINDNKLFAASRNNFMCIIDIETFSISSTFPHDNPISALCSLNNGIIYSVQNDTMFHFRSSDDYSIDHLIPMNPNAFASSAMGIRDLVQCPTDPSIFIALTDICKLYIYRLPVNSKEIEVLKTLTHVISDGLTQLQMLWKSSATLITTSNDMTVIAIDVETDSVVFKLEDWKKATRCISIIGDKLFVGAFDKSISTYKLKIQ